MKRLFRPDGVNQQEFQYFGGQLIFDPEGSRQGSPKRNEREQLLEEYSLLGCSKELKKSILQVNHAKEESNKRLPLLTQNNFMKKRAENNLMGRN